MEHDLDTQLLEHLGNEVGFAHRNAARQDQNIGRIEVLADLLSKQLRLVNQVVVLIVRETVLFEHRDHRGSIRHANLLRLDRLAGWNQFIARRDHSYCREATNFNLGQAGGTDDRNVHWRDALTGLQ